MYERHVQDLISLVPTDGSTVDLQEMFFRLTIDTATEFLFGESCNSLHVGTTGTSNVGFAKAFNDAQDCIAMRSNQGFFAKFNPELKKMDESVRIVHEFVDKYVQSALDYRRKRDLEKAPDSNDERYVFLQELARRLDDPKRLRSELLAVLLAGRDTTASLLGNVFYIIARRPDVWAKLQEDIAQLDGEAPDFEQLRNCKYVRYCLNECRSNPFVPANGAKR